MRKPCSLITSVPLGGQCNPFTRQNTFSQNDALQEGVGGASKPLLEDVNRAHSLEQRNSNSGYTVSESKKPALGHEGRRLENSSILVRLGLDEAHLRLQSRHQPGPMAHQGLFQVRISTRALHNILRLDIQVNDTVRMDVRHGREELSRARTAELVTKRSRGPGLDLETPHTPEPAIQWRGCLLHNVSDPDLANSLQVLQKPQRNLSNFPSCGMGFRESLASPRTRLERIS